MAIELPYQKLTYLNERDALSFCHIMLLAYYMGAFFMNSPNRVAGACATFPSSVPETLR